MKNNRIRILSLFLILLLFCITSVGCSSCGNNNEENQSFVKKERKTQIHDYSVTQTSNNFIYGGKTDYRLIFPKSTNKKFNSSAVSEFVYFFKEATGINIKSGNDENQEFNSEEKYISLGDTKMLKDSPVKLSDDLGTGGFIIKTVGNNIFIAGGQYGEIYGVYAFMKVYFNMEVYNQDEICIDKGVVDKNFLELNVKDVPDIEYMCTPYGMTSTGAQRLRLQSLSGVHIANRNRTWHNLLKGVIPYELYGVDPNATVDAQGNAVTQVMKDEIAKEKLSVIEYLKNNDPTLTDEQATVKAESYFNHPEWYVIEKYASEDPLGDTGKREACQVNFTISVDGWTDEQNAESQELLYQVLIYEMEGDLVTDPLGRMEMAFTTEDNGIWSEDKKSLENLEKYGTNTGEYIQCANIIAGRMKEKYPDFRMVIFGYAATAKPPVVKDSSGKFVPIDESVVLADNVDVMLTFGLDRNYEFEDYEKNFSVIDMEDGWFAISNKKCAWFWGLCYYENCYMPTTTAMSVPNIYRHLFENDYRFILDEGRVGESAATDWAELKTYIISKIRWDVYQNMDDLIQEFFDNFYKQASEPMLELYNMEMNWLTSLKISMDNLANITDSGQAIKLLKTEECWPETLLDNFLSKFDEAYESIKIYQTTNPTLYQTLKDRITMQTLPIRYLKLEIYGKYYEDLTGEWRESLYQDTKKAGIEKFGSFTTIDQFFGK